MAMTERSRSALYRGLCGVLQDNEAVEEMLSYFPARDVEEPVTKDFLRAEMADLRAEMADLRAELRTEMADLRTEFRTELRDGLREQTQWLVGLMVTLSAVIVAVVTLAS